MVRSRLPEGLVSLHPLIADQNILHGIIQGMAHMELSRNIGRRHYNGKGLFVLPYLRVKIFAVQPFLIQTVLNGRRIIGFFQFFHLFSVLSFSSAWFYPRGRFPALPAGSLPASSDPSWFVSGLTASIRNAPQTVSPSFQYSGRYACLRKPDAS